MAELWYYTSEGKQMDAVSIRELKQLVGDGVLKPTDMVWKEGLPRWVRASSLKELFPDPTSTLDKYFANAQEKQPQKPPISVAASPPAPTPVVPSLGSAVNPSVDEDEPRERKRRKDASADDEDSARRPPRRRAAPASSGSNMGILIFLGLGAFVLLFFLCGGVGILLYTVKPDNQAKPQPPIAENKKDGAKPVGDDAKPALPKDGAEKDKDAPKPKDLPLPKDVRVGNGFMSPITSILPGKTLLAKFQVQAGHAARITATAAKASASISLSVVRESDSVEIARTEKPEVSATVNFNLPTTEIVVVRIKNESKSPTKCNVVYDVGAK